jgi:predicted phosphoribosyltransferase
MPSSRERIAGGWHFADRQAAGRKLAEHLRQRIWPDPVVLGVARGGVPVGDVVARTLDAPLDVVVGRKIGVPGHPEFGIGANVPRRGGERSSTTESAGPSPGADAM